MIWALTDLLLGTSISLPWTTTQFEKVLAGYPQTPERR
jgi:hypothetical protein